MSKKIIKNPEVPIFTYSIGVNVGQVVLVRTCSPGLHVGQLVRRDGKNVTLRDARRISSWRGSFVIHSIAMGGINRADLYISVTVPEILLTEAIEIIPVSEGVDLSTTEK